MELMIDHLTKQYGNKLAVNDFTVTLTPGVYGLLGANGAGKTTLMRLLCDILKPSSGEIKFNGNKISVMGEFYRDRLGYLPQEFGYYPEFTAYRFLLYLASLKGFRPVEAKVRCLSLLELVSLSEVKDNKIRTFSGGMKQRLGIAQAMLNEPDLLILDEPTSGLDPKERVRFRNLISSFSKNKIVILSTHIVSDIEFIANEVLVMKDGRLLQKGNPEEITASVDGSVWECTVDKRTAEELNCNYSISNLRNVDQLVTLRIVSRQKPHPEAVNVAPNMEDMYLYYFSDAINTMGGNAVCLN